MVVDYERRRNDFWIAFEDTLFVFTMDCAVHHQLIHIPFLKVMNNFMDYEADDIFDNYVSHCNLFELFRIRYELLNYFSAYCNYKPERTSLELICQFEAKGVCTSSKKLDNLKKQVLLNLVYK